MTLPLLPHEGPLLAAGATVLVRPVERCWHKATCPFPPPGSECVTILPDDEATMFSMGEYLADELKARGMDSRELARHIGGTMQEQQVNELTVDLIIAAARTCPEALFDDDLMARISDVWSQDVQTWRNLDNTYKSKRLLRFRIAALEVRRVKELTAADVIGVDPDKRFLSDSPTLPRFRDWWTTTFPDHPFDTSFCWLARLERQDA